MIVGAIQPRAEFVHWWFATGFLVLGLLLYAEVVVGPEVWGRRPWRRYLWPGTCFLMGVLMWPVMTFFTNSMIHMVAHGSWAQVLMLSGGAELGLVRGKLNRSVQLSTGCREIPHGFPTPGRRAAGRLDLP